jgi:SAM-dependent methyltransferase
MPTLAVDPVWEEMYAQGSHLNRYPYDCVVRFVHRHAPRDRQRADVQILEIGVGAGNNLWFAAREGFGVAGVDASPTAIAAARTRFAADGLDASRLVVADFTRLPFPADSFDLIVNRAALPCVGYATAARAVAEVHRVSRPGARFFNQLYSDSCSVEGVAGPDGVLTEIKGALAGFGQIAFYGRNDIARVFGPGWTMVEIAHLARTDMTALPHSTSAAWEFVVERSAT